MGKLCVKAMDYKYKEYDRMMKEQFINGLDSGTMVEEIIKELPALTDTSEVRRKQILFRPGEWRCRRCRKSCWTISKMQKSLTQKRKTEAW